MQEIYKTKMIQFLENHLMTLKSYSINFLDYWLYVLVFNKKIYFKISSEIFFKEMTLYKLYLL